MKKVGTFLLVLLLFSFCDSDNNSNDDVIQIMEYNASSEYIAIYGDIQYYTNATYNHLFQHSCDWILAQKHAGMNINSVLLVGDVTQQNSKGLWKYFESATQRLAQEIPFISAIGDHDYTWSDEDGYSITNRNNTEFSKYLGFPLTKQKVVAWFEKGHMENIVVENYIHGMPIYFLVLEFGPREEVVDWANEYVKNHPNIRFILINHEYLEMGGGRRTSNIVCRRRLKDTNSTYTNPTQLWNRLIKKNDNILCVLCGHVGGLYAYTPDENDFGREVPQIQHNIQGPKYRYDNWLMLWEFPQENDYVNVSIINTKSMKFFEDKPILFKFRFKYD